MKLKFRHNSKGPASDKSFAFAIEIVKSCRVLMNNHEYVLSKQLLRSGTAIGALSREAQSAESRKDFIHKLAIALKEADETIYWIDLLYETDYISHEKHSFLSEKASELYRLISSSIITAKTKF